MVFLTKAPNTLPTLSIDGQFSNSNPTCNHESFVLEIGSESFEMTSDGEIFTLTMTEEANVLEIDFSYTVRAIAEGSAEATVSG